VLLVQAIEEFFNGYFSTHERSAKTRIAYHSDLVQLASYAGNNFKLASLDPSFVDNWAADLRSRNYSPASMRRKMVVLKVFCSYWVRKGLLVESPFWRVKLSFGRIKQLPRSLTETEMRGLLAQAKRNQSAADVQRKAAVLAKGKPRGWSLREYRALRNLALLDLLFATGMRVGEVSALDLHDFLISEVVFRVKGKGGLRRKARPCSLTRPMDGSRPRASPTSFLNFIKTPVSNGTSHRTCCGIPSPHYCCETELTSAWCRNFWVTLRSPRRSDIRTSPRITSFRSSANDTRRSCCDLHEERRATSSRN
jgi:Phage integrase, N-terminal SAM-like domain